MDKKQYSTKKDTLYQIYLPLGIFILLILTLGVLAIVSTTNNFSQTADWANISVVILSVPFFMISLLFLAILILLIYAQSKLLKWLPIQTKRLYALILRVSAFVWRFSDKAASPIINVKSWSAAVRRFFSTSSNELR